MKHYNEFEMMVLTGLVELVGIHFVSIKWSLNIPVEMLIRDPHGFRYCSHTHKLFRRNDLLIQRIWQCKLCGQ